MEQSPPSLRGFVSVFPIITKEKKKKKRKKGRRGREKKRGQKLSRGNSPRSAPHNCPLVLEGRGEKRRKRGGGRKPDEPSTRFAMFVGLTFQKRGEGEGKGRIALSIPFRWGGREEKKREKRKRKKQTAAH